MEQIINISSLLIAAAALVVAAYSWLTASRAARNDVLAQVRDWGGEVVDLLAHAGELCELNLVGDGSGEFTRMRNELRSRASALLDRGRFFFPNLEGFRPQILDLVMIAYELIPGIADRDGANERRMKAFNYLQTVTVSAIRMAVNFSISPATVKNYEDYLATIRVQPLPSEILDLIAKIQDFEVSFDNRTLDELPPRDLKTRDLVI